MRRIVEAISVLVCGALFVGAAPASAPAPSKPALPRMQLQAQYAGPLQDTVIQRWRDADGIVCFTYLPIAVHHSAPAPSGYVEYGANSIGSISCVAPPGR